MTLPVLTWTPVSDGFAVPEANDSISTQLKGGSARVRVDVLYADRQVPIQWILDGKEYNDFMYFYRNTINRGADEFNIDLPIGYSINVTCTATFIPGTVKLTQQKGLAWFVSGTLSVRALTPDQEAYYNTLAGVA